MQTEEAEVAISTVLIALMNVTVRRDANTILNVEVPEYEIPALKTIHGKENVNLNEAKQIAGEKEFDPGTEHERLSSKYGHELVAKVYGDDDGERLSEKVNESAAKYARFKKANAAKEPKETAAEKKARTGAVSQSGAGNSDAAAGGDPKE